MLDCNWLTVEVPWQSWGLIGLPSCLRCGEVEPTHGSNLHLQPALTQSRLWLLVTHLHLSVGTSASSNLNSWHFSALKWTRLEVLDHLEAAACSTNEMTWQVWWPIRGQRSDLAARPGSLEAIWAAAPQHLSRSETMWGEGGDDWLAVLVYWTVFSLFWAFSVHPVKLR